MMDQDTIKPGDVLVIIKRRKWYIIVPAVSIFLLAVILAIFLPRTYRSTSTILIEEQEIPREYVMTTVSSYAEQRLQSINQRIMSSTRLTEIIKNLNLYADRRNKQTTEEMIDKMRKDIKFEMISADVIDRRAGRKTAAAIAFSISYEGSSPAVVQQVANVLTSLYLEENLRVREQQTEGAMRFMDDERKAVEAQLAEIERQIAVFKQKNSDAMPDLAKYNIEGLDKIEQNLDKLKARLAELKEMEGRYTEIHPDFKKTKREIESVKHQIADAEKQRREYDRRLASSARVEEGYTLLIAKRHSLQAKYDDISKKYHESKTASGLEKDQMGERFTLLDAARLPEKPVSPKVPAILLIGLVLGLGAGAGSAALKEFSDHSVRNAGSLSRALGLPVLAVIPEIVTAREMVRDTQRRMKILIGIAVVIIFAIVVFHFFVMDLDILRARIMRRI